MHPPFQLNGRAALIAGSARGIGKAVALGLAECGATEVVHDTQPGAVFATTLIEVQRHPPHRVAMNGDLAEPGTAGRVVVAATSALMTLTPSGNITNAVTSGSITETQLNRAIGIPHNEKGSEAIPEGFPAQTAPRADRRCTNNCFPMQVTAGYMLSALVGPQASLLIS